MAAGTVFSATLQSLRKNKGVTQEQLATHLGVSAQAVSKWENGNYPEGDLIPKIADYFNVSISYLYGQEKEEVSLEQHILETLYGIMKKDYDNGINSNHSDYFEKMLDIAWAFQIGCWQNNKYYYKREKPQKDTRTASVYTDDAGYGYFNLNVEKQFFMLVKEPDDGFAKNMEITDRHRAFFGLLGRKGVLEIISYLLTLNWGQCVTVSTIAKETLLPEKEVREILKEASSLKQSGNPPFHSIEIINNDGVEKAYGINTTNACMFISLMLVAESLINPPYGYQMQVGSRTKSWLDRKDVEEMIKEVKKNGKKV